MYNISLTHFASLICLWIMIAILPSSSTHAQGDADDITVHVRIDRLEALNLSDDGLFDDGEDEIELYYALTEVDRFGNVLENGLVYQKFERRFNDGEVHDVIPELAFDIAPTSTATVTILLIEVDDGNFALDEYLDNLDFSSNSLPDQECGLQALASTLIAIGTTNPAPLAAIAPACFDDAINTLTTGGDDLFGNPLVLELPSRIAPGYETSGTHEFRWSNETTNSSQYRLDYTIEVSSVQPAIPHFR